MVIKTHQGLFRVTKVKGYCEMRVRFNGKLHRLIQPAKNISYVSALLFNVEEERGNVNGFMEESQDVFIANLTNEMAQRYMDILAKDGYLDLTLTDYQKESPLFKEDEYVFDNGISKPYFCNQNVRSCVWNNLESSYYENEDDQCFDDDALTEED